jgi:hypothetical protein
LVIGTDCIGSCKSISQLLQNHLYFFHLSFDTMHTCDEFIMKIYRSGFYQS